jgi:hypothetical protein
MTVAAGEGLGRLLGDSVRWHAASTARMIASKYPTFINTSRSNEAIHRGRRMAS